MTLSWSFRLGLNHNLMFTTSSAWQSSHVFFTLWWETGICSSDFLVVDDACKYGAAKRSENTPKDPSSPEDKDTYRYGTMP